MTRHDHSLCFITLLLCIVATCSFIGKTEPLQAFKDAITNDPLGALSASAAFQGTIGYMAPEFAYTRKVTTKVDVFSFGVIVIELLTKQRPTGIIEENGVSITLPQTVEKAIASGTEGLLGIIDPQLISHISKDQDILENILKLALSCTSTNPEDRPDMNAILFALLKLNKHITLSTSSNNLGNEGPSTSLHEKNLKGFKLRDHRHISGCIPLTYQNNN